MYRGYIVPHLHPLIVSFECNLQRLLECDVFAGPRDRRARGQAKSSKEPQASSSSSDSGQSGTKQLDKKGGETEIESSPSPLSHAAPPSATRPSAANLPTQHGQPLQRPHSAPVSTLKRVACSSKGPRPQSAPDSSRPARPKQSHPRGESGDTGPLSNGTHSVQAKSVPQPNSLPQPSGPGRPPIPKAPVHPADGHSKASQPESRQQPTDRTAPAGETVKAHTNGSRKNAAGLSNGKQSAEGRGAAQSFFNRGIRDGQQSQASSQPNCKDPKHPKAAPAARNSHALVPTDCFDNLSRA